MVWDDLNNFKAEHSPSLLVDKIEGKGFKMTLPRNEEEGTEEIVVKVKFFQQTGKEESEGTRTRIKFIKKRGDLT